MIVTVPQRTEDQCVFHLDLLIKEKSAEFSVEARYASCTSFNPNLFKIVILQHNSFPQKYFYDEALVLHNMPQNL
jgi:hypothetical protein